MAVTDLGAAVEAFSAVGAVVADSGVHVVSRNVAPALLLAVDADAGTVVDTDQIPSGEGAWGVTAAPDGIYVGMFGARGAGNLYRWADGEVQVKAAIDALYIWDLATGPDGTVYGVTSDPAQVFGYSPTTGLAHLIGVLQPGEGPRACTVHDDRLVVGGTSGGGGLLVASGTDGSGRQSILPPQLADHQVYAARHTADGRVAIGTTGPGRTTPAIAVVDPADPAAAVVVRLPREITVDAVVELDGTVYATARPSGAVYALAPDGDLRRLAVPLPGAETRTLGVVGGDVAGVSADGTVFRLAPGSGALTRWRPDDLGLPRPPQLVQSLAVRDDVVWAGGTFAVQRRRLADDATTTWFVPGEPKDVTITPDGTAHLALYPLGEVWAVFADDDRPRRLAALPSDQPRPIALEHSTHLGCLVVTTAGSDGPGALHTIDPVTGRVDSVVGPLGSGGDPAGLALVGRTAYVGGSGGAPVVAAWDLVTQQVVWQVGDVAPGGGFVLGLAVVGNRLHTLSTRGEAAVVDLGSRQVTARRRVAETAGRLRAAGRRVLAVTTDQLLELHPSTLEPTVVADGLAAEVWGWPPLAVDEASRPHVVHGRQVARIT